ncbi:M48 family metalloprotease [Alphaproteobacteria bacterium GH1-50]|uniref:M48 family metalloprotease n=1 Tax=Kangsaoukella pontilimi TaxID=2691042 RepID=A0A7C9MAI1_9RHOB|nr:M48 family metallopeptidase [Kangsaoukella pontilimi]MXQ08053.1 M48 family metalloprotease [Kangsaoukella pontilimi]
MSAQGFADFFDGKQASVRRVGYRVETGGIVLDIPEQGERLWPMAALREIGDQAVRTNLVLTLEDAPMSRLILTDKAAIGAVRSGAKSLRKGMPVRGLRAVLGWAVGAVASVALIVLVLVPIMADQLARILPAEGERALGEATLGQIQTALADDFSNFVPICQNPEGLDAMQTMLDRLMATGPALPHDVTVTVLDHDMVNAFALPGGQVVFFRGMLETATDPDQIAAVLAHEIGHVAARDPTRIALRSAGSLGVLGLVFGDFAGGAAVLFLVEQLIQADYTREAEAAADDLGISMLRDAEISPAALGDLFEVIRDMYGDAEGIAAHFMSHPSLGDRIDKARAASENMSVTTPSLSDEDWLALQTICNYPWD